MMNKKESTEKVRKPPIPSLYYGALGASFLVIFIAISYVFIFSTNIIERYQPTKFAAMQIRISLLESQLHDNRKSLSKAQPLKPLQQAAAYTGVLLEGGKTGGQFFYPVSDRGIRALLEQMRSKLQVVIQVVQKETPGIYEPQTVLRNLGQLYSMSVHIENEVNHRIQNEHHSLHLIQLVLLSCAAILTVFTVIIIYSFERKKAEQFMLITSVNSKLADSNRMLKLKEKQLKKGTLELRESEQKYRSFVQTFDGIAYREDIGFKPVFFHGAVKKISGYTELQFLAGDIKWEQLILKEDYERLSATGDLKKIKSVPDFSTQREYRIRRKDGGIVWIFEQIQNVPDENGTVKYIQGVLHDISRQKDAEQKLEQSDARYKTLFLESADGILIAEVETKKFRYANPAICRMLGYKEKELLSLTVDDIHPASDLPAVLENFQKQAKGEIYQTNNIPCITKNGKVIYVDISAKSTIVDGVVCNIGFFRDVTERKKIIEELIKTQKLESLGILAGGIAHDFNNLLNGIFGYLDLIKESSGEDQEINDYCERALSAYYRAKDLTRQLLTFAKGGLPRKTAIDIEKVIREAMLISLSGSWINTEYAFSNKLWKIEADEGQISQVISNLAINARQAMEGGGTITVKAENIILDKDSKLPLNPGAYLKISFGDQGGGIPDELTQKIFDPFFTTKQEGSGLGLATVYSIIKKHEGYITMVSELGKGTVFYMYLPAMTRDITIARKTEQSPEKGSGRILLMDDEDLVQQFVKTSLRQLGYSVTTAQEGREAVELYKQARASGNPYLAVILDLTVPAGMGGEQTLKELQKIDPDIKAIVSSGYADNEIMSKYKEYGFKAAVSKPYRVNELSKVLKTVLSE